MRRILVEVVKKPPAERDKVRRGMAGGEKGLMVMVEAVCWGVAHGKHGKHGR